MNKKIFGGAYLKTSAIISATLALVFLAIIPSYSAQIVPGTYKLEWNGNFSASSDLVSTLEVTLMNTNDVKPKLLNAEVKSKKAMFGQRASFAAIIDESKGTGKGYDVLYIQHVGSTIGIKDLSKAIQIPLVKKNGRYCPATTTPVFIELPVEGSETPRRVAVDITIGIPDGADPKMCKDLACNLTIKGACTGKVKTDEGDLDVTLLDTNQNGQFGDMTVPDRSKWMFGLGDMLVFGNIPQKTSAEDDVRRFFLDKNFMYDNKLYTIESNEVENTLTINPYTGETGKVVITAVDGFGKSVTPLRVFFQGDAGDFASVGNEAVLPIGEYNVTECLLSSKSNNKEFSIDCGPAYRPITVSKDKTANIKIGGPIFARMYTFDGTLEYEQGEIFYHPLMLGFSKDDHVRIESGITTARVEILSGAKRVWSTMAKERISCSGDYGFTIPANIKPGKYQLVLTVDAMPYQKCIQLKMPLKVVKHK